MAQLIFDLSGRGGLVQNSTQTTRNIYLGGENQMATGLWNPFLRYGYMSPPTTTLTNVTVDQSLNAQLVSSIYDPVNDDFYFAEAGRQLYKGDTTSDTSLARAIQLADASAVIKDLEIYTINGVRKLFVMYQDGSGNPEIAVSSLPYDTGTDNETFLDTPTHAGDDIGGNTLAGDFWMQVADNGFSYLFMENQVHRFDGTANGGSNGTMAANALLFPASFRLVDSIDYRGNLFIALHQYSTNTRDLNPSFTPSGQLECGVYVWDRQSTVVRNVDYFPLKGVSQINKIYVSPSGQVRLLVMNAEGVTEIRQFTGSTFEIIHRVGYGAQPVFRDAVTQLGSMTYWWSKGGDLYAHGSIIPGEREGLFKIKNISTASTNAGALLGSSGTSSSAPALYISYQDADTSAKIGRYKIYNLTSQLGTDEAAAGTVSTLEKFLPQMSTVRHIDIYMAAGTGSGTTSAGTVAVYFNGSNSAWATKTITRGEAARGYRRIEVNKPYVNSIQLEIAFATGTAIGGNDFAPAFAVVEYDNTSTKG